MSTASTAARLSLLESAGLIQLAALHPELEYVFRHMLVKEAAYASLVKGDRRGLHRLAAEALEQLYLSTGSASPARTDLLPLLAHHFAEAGAREPAVRYFTQAGDAALRVYANLEAIMHFGRAIELLPPGPESQERLIYLYTRRGRAYEVTGQQSAALASYHALEALGYESGLPGFVLNALTLRATLLALPSIITNPPQAIELAQTALQLAREQGNQPMEARVLWALMVAEYFNGHPARAAVHGEQALPLARALKLRELTALILNDLSRALLSTGRVEASRVLAEEARALWRAEGNLSMLAETVSNLASSYYFSGDYGRALELLQESQALTRTTGDAWGQSYSLMMQGFLFMEQGLFDEAFASAAECLRLCAQAGFYYPQVVVPSSMALAYSLLGQPARGLALAEHALAMANEHAPELRSEVTAVLAQLHAELGDTPRAEAFLRQSRAEMAIEDQMAFAPILTAALSSELALSRGQAEQAAAAAGKAAAEFEKTNMQVFLADLMVHWARALRHLGRLDEAEAVLRRGQAIVDKQQSRRAEWVVLAERAALAEQRGEAEAARALRVQARVVIEFIVDHLSDAELRASFLNGTAVQAVLA